MGDVKIYGASDGFVEVEGEGVLGADEYPCSRARLRLIGDGKTTLVAIAYGDSLWGISVQPVDEGFPMHDVEITQSTNGYSAVARVSGVEQVVMVYKRDPMEDQRFAKAMALFATWFDHLWD